MGRADYLALGDWNTQCYQCGRKRKASTMKKHWQGYWVCPEHWEPRHPQDFVRNVTDNMTPPWSQPQPAPVFTIPTGTLDSVFTSDTVTFTVFWDRVADTDTITTSDDVLGTVGYPINDIATMSEDIQQSTSMNPADITITAETLRQQVFTVTQLNGSAIDTFALNSNLYNWVTPLITDTVTSSDSLSSSFSSKLIDISTTSDGMSNELDSTLSDISITSDTVGIQIFDPTQLNGISLNGKALNGN